MISVFVIFKAKFDATGFLGRDKGAVRKHFLNIHLTFTRVQTA
jgi:hypothetical protein